MNSPRRPRRGGFSPGSPRPSPARRAGRPPAVADLPHHIYGLHPVVSALANPLRRRHKLLATANALRRFEAMAAVIDVPVEETEAVRLSRLLGGDAVHQGCVLYCEPLPDHDLTEFLAASRLALLDQVTDPHNVGAVIRSAAAFAVEAVVVTERHSPRETPVLAKSAAGALDIVPLIRVRNLSKALGDLAATGFATIGLDAGAEQAIDAAPLAEPFALVLGAEGRGLRQKTKETCTRLARVDMPGRMPSLNVSNAAALAFYIADRAVRRS